MRSDSDRRRGGILILIILLVLLLGAAAFFGARLYKDYRAKKQAEALADSYSLVTEENTADIRPANPVDFAALQERNSEIYAWIIVPNTEIELPILQSCLIPIL